MEQELPHEESRETSPPSSSAPHSEDEFTTSVMRHAAKALGLEYSKPVYRRVPAERARAANAEAAYSRPGHRNARMLLHDLHSRTLQTLREIDLRSKALGPDHESVGLMHLEAARLFGLQDEYGKAEFHFTAALDILPQRSDEGAVSMSYLAVLSEVGQFFAATGQMIKGRNAFLRAAEMCDAGVRGGDRAASPNRRASNRSPMRAGALEADAKLKATLLHWKASQSAQQVGDALITSAVSEVLVPRLPPPVHDESVQADEVEIELQGRAAIPGASSTLSHQQREQLREPTLRTAADVRSLVSYLKDSEMESSRVAVHALAQSVLASLPPPPQAHGGATELSAACKLAKDKARALQETLAEIRRERGR